MKKYISIILAALALCLALPAFGANDKIAKDLKKQAAGTWLDVIVQFDSAVPTDLDKNVAKLGGKLKTKMHGAKMGLVRVKAKDLAALSSDPRVKFITPDRSVSGELYYSTYATAARTIQAAGWKGAGVGIAVIDSGLEMHPDFKTYACGSSYRIVYQQSSCLVIPTTTDGYGHGTHVGGHRRRQWRLRRKSVLSARMRAWRLRPTSSTLRCWTVRAAARTPPSSWRLTGRSS